ncbi:DUF2332 family protein [Nocardia fluminea]|uniref:DUF2332 family protein n=1 Tax=Nocardia fluminea TaxID=134984 RepID=UPI0036634BCA
MPSHHCPIPRNLTVVVFHSAVLSYLSPQARADFRATVRNLPCHWVSQEGTGVLSSLADRLPPRESTAARLVLALDDEPLAFAGPHGQSLDWFGPA